jgi:phosphoglycerate dehydrogenase-like enzyme
MTFEVFHEPEDILGVVDIAFANSQGGRTGRNIMSRNFVIIGLGRLGSAMLETLLSLDHEVLGIDSDEDLVQNLSGEFPAPT